MRVLYVYLYFILNDWIVRIQISIFLGIPASEKPPGCPADQSVKQHKHTRQNEDNRKHADDCAARQHGTDGVDDVNL